MGVYILNVLDDGDPILCYARLVLIVFNEDVPAHGAEGDGGDFGYFLGSVAYDLRALLSVQYFFG